MGVYIEMNCVIKMIVEENVNNVNKRDKNVININIFNI